jgi:broad specificity phosphatase PhoE
MAAIASPAAAATQSSWRFIEIQHIAGRPAWYCDGMASEVWLIRHGETEWSRSGKHTGRTDLPLTDQGRKNGEALGRLLDGRRFSLVLTSPLERARETCRLAGFGGRAEIDPNLREWDYGDFEGRTTPEIRKETPTWSLWSDGPRNGESIAQVAARADAVIARVLAAEGDAALFGHGHLLRIITARWLGFPPDAGRRFALGTAAVCVLGYERETRVIARWGLTVSA